MFSIFNICKNKTNKKHFKLINKYIEERGRKDLKGVLSLMQFFEFVIEFNNLLSWGVENWAKNVNFSTL